MWNFKLHSSWFDYFKESKTDKLGNIHKPATSIHPEMHMHRRSRTFFLWLMWVLSKTSGLVQKITKLDNIKMRNVARKQKSKSGNLSTVYKYIYEYLFSCRPQKNLFYKHYTHTKIHTLVCILSYCTLSYTHMHGHETQLNRTLTNVPLTGKGEFLKLWRLNVKTHKNGWFIQSQFHT